VSVTLQQLINGYPAWHVQNMAGGWVALRRNLVPQTSGLSNVRCGQTLDELAANLQTETSLRPVDTTFGTTTGSNPGRSVATQLRKGATRKGQHLPQSLHIARRTGPTPGRGPR
jgi:hypothetical protein